MAGSNEFGGTYSITVSSLEFVGPGGPEEDCVDDKVCVDDAGVMGLGARDIPAIATATTITTMITAPCTLDNAAFLEKRN